MGTVMKRVWLIAAVLLLLLAVLPRAAGAQDHQSAGAVGAAGADGNEAARAARWKALSQAIFPGRSLQDGGGVVQLEAPPRALDAALVPVSLDFPGSQPIKSVYLIIDDNPSPLAAHFTFGPESDARNLKLRVRVDAYTNLHAVAETRDGKLYSASKFIKASGGCSAPAGPDDAAALKDIGLMKLRLLGPFAAGKPLQAQLMIRHPNFNGMQMNQITRFYTPARFIRTIDASYAGGSVFHLDSDISLSTDPVITFGFIPKEKGQMKIVARDSSNVTFDRSFDVPGAGG
jgi:sulfur-oxidizing protein SoxY